MRIPPPHFPDIMVRAGMLDVMSSAGESRATLNFEPVAAMSSNG